MTVGHAPVAATYAVLLQGTNEVPLTPPAPPPPTTITPFPGGPKVTVAPDGQMTVIAPDGAVTILERDGRMRRIDPEGRVTQTSGPPAAAEEQMPDGAFVSIIGLGLLSAFVVGRWWTTRKFRKQGAGSSPYAAGIPAELGGRIDRIEHAIESVAIEVERISEGQRFTTRLLTDRGEDPAAILAARANEVGGSRR